MKNSPHSKVFSLNPFAQLALAYMGGVFLSTVLNVKPSYSIILCAICSFIALVALITNRLQVAGSTLLVAMSLAGISLATIEKSVRPANGIKRLIEDGVIEEDQTTTLTGVLDGPPEYARDRLYFVLSVESISSRTTNQAASGSIALLASFNSSAGLDEYRKLNLRYGTRVVVRTALSRTNKYCNPGVSGLTEYLDQKNYDATGIVKNPQSMARLGETSVFRPLGWLYLWRESIQREIDEHFSAETAGVLDAAILGNRYNLSKGTSERFREGGTFHVLVISGLHISFVGGFVLLLVRRLTRKRILQFLFSTSVVWGYTLAVGAAGSVVRAALMFTFVALGNVIFRSASALNALGATALILLIRSPKDLFDPSLQLTLVSVLAIVIIAWPLLQTFRKIGEWRPTRDTPYPPTCPAVVRSICEVMFWSEREWKSEIDLMPHHYRIFKSPLAVWLERRHLQRLIRYVFNALVVSLSVQCLLLPFLIVYFHRLSIASLLLNIGVSVVLVAVSSVGLFALLVNLASPAMAGPFFKLADKLNWLMVHSVDPFSRIGLSSFRIPEYSGLSSSIYFLYFLPLIFLLLALSRWSPLGPPAVLSRRNNYWLWVTGIVQIVLLATVILHPWSAGRPDGKLHIDFLDVGQGDSALITLPNGATLLVDGGGRPTFFSANDPKADATSDMFDRESRSIGEMVVSEYLWWRGLDHVDYVLATHADADHIDGLNDVVRNFRVKSALVGRTPASDPEYVKFAQTLSETGTHLETINAGDELRFGVVTASVLWPNQSTDSNAPSQNNDSLVLRLKFGERSILLTGDIEKEAEGQIVAANPRLDVDIVKVPHHGSRTSSTLVFVEATSPQFAIISVGRTSMFGHPHKEVVERWTNKGATVSTTGRCGTINVITDGKSLWMKNFVECH